MQSRWLAVGLGVLLHAANVEAQTEPDVDGATTDDASSDAGGFQEDAFAWHLGGYARSIAGSQHTSVHEPGSSQVAGLAAGVLRLEWELEWGEKVTATVHNRLAWHLASGTSALGAERLGLGASTHPTRTIDLESKLAKSGSFAVLHDVDRLAVRLYLDRADITLGRQAISWGNSLLFSVADLWTSFSPFELDTSEKPGVDAARLLTTVADDMEVDIIAADKGRVGDLSFGARLVAYRDFGDVYLAVAKLWRELILASGAALDMGTVKIRGEAVAPFDLDRRAYVQPRATLGVDWFSPKLVLAVEAHYNGTGAAPGRDYLAHALTSAAFAHGETYLLGRYYLGGLAIYKPHELFTLSTTVLTNVADPSAIVVASAAYQPTSDTELSAGAYVGLGKPPELEPPRLKSELGAYGELLYLQLAIFF